MKLLTFPALLLLLGCAAVTACSTARVQSPDPDEQPYVFEEAFELNPVPTIEFVDLNDDGRDESIEWHQGNVVTPSFVHLRNSSLETIDQVNYSGRVLEPSVLDYDGDGIKEILVPFVRDDSLFVSVVDAQGRKLFYTFLVSGSPRKEEGGILMPWDLESCSFYLVDVDDDGDKELVTKLNTGYARMPRGMMVHSLPDGRVLASKMVGAALGRMYSDDFDGDGRLEFILQTTSPNNGAVAGGFDDKHVYLIDFELPGLRVSWWRKMGEQWANVDLFYEDFDGDRRREFLAVTWSQVSRSQATRLELIEPGTWKIKRVLSLAEPLQNTRIIDLDNDARFEIVMVRSENELWVFDDQFKVRQRRWIGSRTEGVSILPDVDGDGISEIVYSFSGGALLLAPDLSAKAVFAEGTIGQVIHKGAGVPPYIIGNRKGKLVALRLVRNRWYLFNRYGPYGLGALGLGVALAAGMAGASLWRRTRLLQSIQALALDTEDRGLLLLDPSGRVQMTNATFRRWFGLDETRPLQRIHFKEALSETPDLAATLRALQTSPFYHHEQTLSIDLHGSSRQLRVIADPLPAGRKNAPYWLVRVEDRSQEATAQQAQAWTMMAQRVAHDIKNPLTSILLTLQQLQMAYRERVPEQGTAFDPYVDRIIDRIESLRRMTHNFMKFMNAEKSNLVMTDLNAFVEEVGVTIRQSLPSDIELQLNLSPNLPGIRLDRESMQSVLENLIANAVNAMPDGGRITIATSLAQNLPRLSRAGAPEPGLHAQDYAVIEVRDTGFGIPAWARQRLFDLGFTTRERGSGLGLTLAKKIVEDHGGYVEVESEEGVGSVFAVYVPA